jgi:ribosome maturation factor RimP
MATKVTDKVQALLTPECEKLGYELVDVEFTKQGNKYLLRLSIDKPGGINIEDCELVSRTLDPILDEHDPIPSSYYLEVSSPGLDRPLKKESDYIRFSGSLIEVKTYNAINGKRKFIGKLLGYDAGFVRMEHDQEEISIALEQIAKAKLVPEF